MSNGREPLSRERIVAAARALIDEEGLEALSMRKLGARLGVEAMSLYNHVANKDEVLDGVLESLLVEVPLPADDLDWTERLRVLARGFRSVARAHPAMIPLFSTRKVRGARAWQPLLCAYEILRTAGLSPDDAVDAFFATSGYVLGYVLTEVGTLSSDSEISFPPAGSVDVGAEEAASLREMAVHLAGDLDRRFEGGLDLVLGGLVGRIAALRPA